MTPRSHVVRIIYEATFAAYENETGHEMTSAHAQAVLDGLTHAFCIYDDHNFLNDVFHRAALIGFSWAMGAFNWELFGPLSLTVCISSFLEMEGATVAPRTNENDARFAIFTVLRDNCGKTRWDEKPQAMIDLFDDLVKVCALHWVCSEGNDCFAFPEKFCHKAPNNR